MSTGVESSKTVGDTVGEPIHAVNRPGRLCGRVDAVINIGNESQSFFAANQKLMDTAGREHSPDSKADMWIDKAILTDINPGNQIEARVAFDVPQGTQPSAMELHDSMFSGGVKVSLS